VDVAKYVFLVNLCNILGVGVGFFLILYVSLCGVNLSYSL
jgi:hypothetical protein